MSELRRVVIYIPESLYQKVVKATSIVRTAKPRVSDRKPESVSKTIRRILEYVLVDYGKS